jgi:hypothetical protein
MGNAIQLLGGGRYWAAHVLGEPWDAIFWILSLWLMFFLVLRVVLRKTLLAAGVWVAFWTTLEVISAGVSPISWMTVALRSILGLAILLRCGLAAAVVLHFVQGLLWFPLLSDLSAWYVRNGMYSIIAIIALASYSFITLLGGRPRVDYAGRPS